jgi:hypothetical protein
MRIWQVARARLHRISKQVTARINYNFLIYGMFRFRSKEKEIQ